MRLALLADIHGNTVALDAVIADLSTAPPDRIICLGDIAAGGPDPSGAIDRLMDLDVVGVQGNTDAGIVDMPGWWRDPSSIGIPDDAAPGLDISVWSAEQLGSVYHAYLAGLPATKSLALGQAGDLLAFHGSPRSADDLITGTTTVEDLDLMFQGATASLLAGGHTHVPLLRRYRTSTIVNPGSVGMPFAEYGYAGGVSLLHHAAYAVVDVTDDRVEVGFRQVPFAWDELVDSVTRSDMPHGDWWLARWGSRGGVAAVTN